MKPIKSWSDSYIMALCVTWIVFCLQFLPGQRRLSERLRKRLYYGLDRDVSLEVLSSPMTGDWLLQRGSIVYHVSYWSNACDMGLCGEISGGTTQSWPKIWSIGVVFSAKGARPSIVDPLYCMSGTPGSVFKEQLMLYVIFWSFDNLNFLGGGGVSHPPSFTP